jgi:hypothetical protein
MKLRLAMLQLLVNWAPKTQHVSAVVRDLEGPEPVARISQFPMHGHFFRRTLCTVSRDHLY